MKYIYVKSFYRARHALRQISRLCTIVTALTFFLALNSQVSAQTPPETVTIEGACFSGTYLLNKVSDDYDGTGRPAYEGTGSVEIGNVVYNPVQITVYYQPAGPAWTLNLDGGPYFSNPSTDLMPPSGGWVLVDNSASVGNCTGSTPVKVKVPVDIVTQPATSAAACIDGSTSATVVTSGPVTSYEWLKDGNPLSPTQTTATLTLNNLQNTDAGSYTVVVTGADNSVTSDPFVLTVNALPTATVTGGGTVCAGQPLPNVSIALMGTAPFTFTYSDGSTSTPVTTSDNPFVIANAPAGTYTVTALSDANCTGTSLTGSATVTVNPLPTATVSGGGTVCAGQTLPSVSIALTGTAPFTFTYSDGSTSTPVTTSDNPFVIANAAAGTYTVTALSDAHCTGTSLTGSATVTVNPLPTATVSGGGTVCTGQPLPSVSIALTGTAPFTFTYSDGSTSTPVTTSDNPFVIANAPAGTYTVTALSDANCTATSFTGSATVTVSPLSTASIVTSGAPVCAGSDATFTISGTSGATLTYTVTGQAGNQNLALDGTNQSLTFGGATTNVTLTLISVSKDGCPVSLSQASTVTVNPLPSVNAGPDQSVTLGFGSSTSNCTDLSATSSDGSGGGYIVSWGPGSLSGQTVNVCPESTTTYTVTLTDGNGCQATDQVTINVNDVRCGNQNRNVVICYYGITQCVSEKVAARYLKLGATLGPCGSGNTRISYESEPAEFPLQLSLKAYPNPTHDALAVQVLAPTTGMASFETVDAAGISRQTLKRNLVEGLNVVEFKLSSLPAGIYLIRAVDALNRQGVVRISKQ